MVTVASLMGSVPVPSPTPKATKPGPVAAEATDCPPRIDGAPVDPVPAPDPAPDPPPVPLAVPFPNPEPSAPVVAVGRAVVRGVVVDGFLTVVEVALAVVDAGTVVVEGRAVVDDRTVVVARAVVAEPRAVVVDRAFVVDVVARRVVVVAAAPLPGPLSRASSHAPLPRAARTTAIPTTQITALVLLLSGGSPSLYGKPNDAAAPPPTGSREFAPP